MEARVVAEIGVEADNCERGLGMRYEDHGSQRRAGSYNVFVCA